MSSVRLRYQTFEFDKTDIHVRSLWDLQQYDDVDGRAARMGVSSDSWPLFGVVWPSGEHLAQLMFDYEISGKRILEVGCGIGLASLVLNARSANITATDYHPEAERFLSENVKLNGGSAIPFTLTGWADKKSDLGEFDLIIGSDLLYEPEQACLLANFIEQHSSAHCEVIVVDPGRGLHPRFSINMVKLGYSHQQQPTANMEHQAGPLPGQVLRYSR